MIEDQLVKCDLENRQRIEEMVSRMFERHSGRKVNLAILPIEWVYSTGGSNPRQRPRTRWGATWQQDS